MNAILIKPTSKKMYSRILEAIKLLKVPAKILSDKEDNDDEFDLLLSDSIEEGMKSGKASKEEVKRFFKEHGIRID
ncbi:MAG: hypothetical protein HY063_04890 [Bacteroidetes bacterium]|nr:hypothetical protein [Bacteroidota bacterium]